MDLKENNFPESHIPIHWYYRSKAGLTSTLLLPYITETVIDVGAGSGYFSKFLLYTTRAQNAVCIDINYVNDHVQYINGKKIEFVRASPRLPLSTILMMDVLEHIEDDLTFLQNYIEIAPSGSTFFITVPAFSFLWSQHDIFLEHKRRYTRSSLRRLVRQSKLEIVHAGYYFAFVFPIAAAMRKRPATAAL